MANDQSTARRSVVGELATRYGMEPDTFEATLRATCMPVGGPPVTREEFAAFILVCKEHGLNPVTREIFAMRRNSGDGLVPVVSVDGWAKKVNEHPACNGFEFRYSDEVVTMPEGAKPCPEWCEISIWRKDRERPIVIREFLDETYQPPRGQYKKPGAWQTHTKRMLRHKTLVQGARLAFGFAGIYDEDEAERIIQSGEPRDITPSQPTKPAGPPRGVQTPQVIEHHTTVTVDVAHGAADIEKPVDVITEAEQVRRAREEAGRKVEEPRTDIEGAREPAKPAGPPRGVSKPPAADPRKAYNWLEIEARFRNAAKMAIDLGNMEGLEAAHANLIDAYEFTPDELDMLNKLYDEAEALLN